MHPAKLTGDNPHHILYLLDCFLTSSKDGGFRMSCLVNGVMVDIYHIHSPHQSSPFCPLHTNDFFVFQGDAFGVGGLQDFIPHRRFGGFTVRQYRHFTGLNLCRQLLMRQEGRHAELRDRRENTLHGADFHLALRFPAQHLCQFGSNLIAHGVGDYDINSCIRCSYLIAIKIRLRRDIGDLAIFL